MVLFSFSCSNGSLNIISTEYQSRFLLLSFVPIALLVPLGLKYIEYESILKKPSYKTQISLLIAGIAIIFAFSSFYTASTTFSAIGPSISEEQYAELVAIKENATALGITESTVLASSDFTTSYWIEYVFDRDVQLNNIQNNSTNQSVYYITLSSDGTKESSNQQRLMMGSDVPGSFFLPYGPSLLPNSADVVTIGNQSQNQKFNNTLKGDGKFNVNNHANGTMNGTAPPGGLNGTMGNRTALLDMSNGTQMRGNGTPPQGMQNGTTPPGNFSSNSPTNSFNRMPGGSNSLSSLTSSGTLIFNGDYVKVYKISI